MRILSLFSKEYAPNVLVSFRDVIPERQLENVNRFQTAEIAQQIAEARRSEDKKYRMTLTIMLDLLKILFHISSYFY